jgi:hypothetical protein
MRASPVFFCALGQLMGNNESRHGATLALVVEPDVAALPHLDTHAVHKETVSALRGSKTVRSLPGLAPLAPNQRLPEIEPLRRCSRLWAADRADIRQGDWYQSHSSESGLTRHSAIRLASYE